MTSYSVSAGNVAAHAKTLVADTADAVSFADNVSTVRIVVVAAAAGAAPIYVTGDGSAPTVAGANTNVLAAVAGAELVLELSGSVDQVRLISAGAHTYSVEGNG